MKSELSALYEFLDRLKEKEEVDAIFLLGGLGKQEKIHPIDQYSDYDISIYIAGEKSPQWLPQFSFNLCLDDGVLGKKINLYQAYTSSLNPNESRWSTAKCEAYINRKVYYAKENWLSAKIDEIIAKSYDEKNILINNYHKMLRFINNDEKLLYRDSPQSLAFLYSKSLELGIESVFLLNGQLMPHLKWIEIDIKQLPWKPDGFSELINLYWSISGLSCSAFFERKKILCSIHNSIYKKCQELKINYNYDYVNTSINSDRQINKKTFFDKCRDKHLYQNISSNSQEFICSYISCNLIDNEDEIMTAIAQGII